MAIFIHVHSLAIWTEQDPSVPFVLPNIFNQTEITDCSGALLCRSARC
jgi:hypothetical protein